MLYILGVEGIAGAIGMLIVLLPVLIADDLIIWLRSGKKKPLPEKKNMFLLTVDSQTIEVAENETQNGPVSYIIYRTFFQDKDRKFVSDSMEMSSVGLRILLEKKKKIYLYVKREDPDIYFFDLNFLSEKK